jgi:adenosylcobinamide-phosphate synthase
MLGSSLEKGPLPDIVALVLSLLLDLVLGEPPNQFHPVAWMGKVIRVLDRWAPKRGKIFPFLLGIVIALAVPGIFTIVAYIVTQGLYPLGEGVYLLGVAVMLKTTFSVRMLGREACRVCRGLEESLQADTREGLRSLVRRDSTTLTPELAASAAVESVAESTVDSFVAPWLVYAICGLPGAVAYRAINTLDSMVGYHGVYEYIGKASARLDDVVNLVPARLSAFLILIASAVKGFRTSNAWCMMWRDRTKTESPNAGWVMSAMAGALGIRLEKMGYYQLGDPLVPLTPDKIKQAIKIMHLVALCMLILCIEVIFVRHVIL